MRNHKTLKHQIAHPGKITMDLREAVASTLAAIAVDGWISRGAALNLDVMATADRVWFRSHPAEWCGEEPYGPPIDFIPHLDAADAATAWMKAETDSDYIRSCKDLIETGICDSHTIGLAASIAGSYFHHLKLEAQMEALRKPDPVGSTIGNIKQRLVFTDLEVVGLIHIEGDYGHTVLHRFVDPEGRTVVWFATGRPLQTPDGDDIELGEHVNIKATVKLHKFYQGTHQTLINRAVLMGMGA